MRFCLYLILNTNTYWEKKKIKLNTPTILSRDSLYSNKKTRIRLGLRVPSKSSSRKNKIQTRIHSKLNRRHLFWVNSKRRTSCESPPSWGCVRKKQLLLLREIHHELGQQPAGRRRRRRWKISSLSFACGFDRFHRHLGWEVGERKREGKFSKRKAICALSKCDSICNEERLIALLSSNLRNTRLSIGYEVWCGREYWRI